MKSLRLLILPIIFIACLIPSVCQANAAPPPLILIIVPNAPEGLEIGIGPDNVAAHRTDKALESYFAFYSYDLESTDYTLKVNTGDATYDLTMDIPPKSYNNIYTLDLEARTLTPGTAPWRSISLVAIRVLLTLVIEGVVFFLFGYRGRRAWLVFLIVNLVTQAGLYVWLDASSTNPLDSYIIFSLVFGEFLVFIIEMIAFLIFIKGYRRWRTALYVIAANLLSLMAGGYLIQVLPI